MAELNLNAATYEQIVTLLTQLATNYSNMAGVFYDVFYNSNPENVTFKMFDESGVLRDYTVKNLALSNKYRMTGNGDPEGAVESEKGVIYQDLTGGDLYIKRTEEGTEGWAKLLNKAFLDKFIIQGNIDPNGSVSAPIGTLYVDTVAAGLYISIDQSQSKWAPISSSFLDYASRNLDNLTVQGLNVIKELITTQLGVKTTSIGTGSTNGQIPTAKAVYDKVFELSGTIEGVSNTVSQKQDKANLVTEISADSTDTQYPSAKCMYDLIGNLEDIINNL